jgi:hypothetical protein
MARIGAAIAVAGLAAAGIAGRAARAALAASFTVLGHLHWIWIPAAIVLKRRPWPPLRSCCADCSRPAGQRRRPADAGHCLCGQHGVGLGAPGRTRAGHRLHLPRFSGHGADAPLVGWSLLAGGVSFS